MGRLDGKSSVFGSNTVPDLFNTFFETDLSSLSLNSWNQKNNSQLQIRSTQFEIRVHAENESSDSPTNEVEYSLIGRGGGCHDGVSVVQVPYGQVDGGGAEEDLD